VWSDVVVHSAEGPRPDLVVLLANYRLDGQQSMLRYASALARDLGAAGIPTRVVHPAAVCGAPVARLVPRLAKWAGYVDKYVVFVAYLVVLRLSLARRRGVVFHICDQGNAPWLRALPRGRTVITCHDVIAIRAALGEEGTGVAPSRTGRLLQGHILRWLLRARWVTCVSQHTLSQVEDLAGRFPDWANSEAQRVHIPNALNADFSPLPEADRVARLAEVGMADAPQFLLHVGHGHPRKNRALLVRLLVDQAHPWPGIVCFAGGAVDPDLQAVINECGVDDRVRSVVGPTHEQLVALYQSCAAFVFPSFSEGFGWPIIEAQQAGAPVLASDVAPMPEVGGDGARYADPRQPGDFAEVLSQLDLADQAGARNADRFDPQAINETRLELYAQIAHAHP
jgi:glycosyltransferase involved in cell wall biosynthesis